MVVLVLLTSFPLGSSLRVSVAALGSQPWELGSLNFCSREFSTRICLPSLWGVLYVFLSQSWGAYTSVHIRARVFFFLYLLGGKTMYFLAFGFVQGASYSFAASGRMGSSISCASELAIGISVSAFGAAILSSSLSVGGQTSFRLALLAKPKDSLCS